MRRSTLLWPAAAAAALHLVMACLYLAAFDGDLSALVCVKNDWAGQPPFEAVQVSFGPGGFDGQFYYVLAQDPWRAHQQFIDLPPYRHQRILYPALAWALSGGGDPWRLLWVLPAINLIAVAVLAWLGARLASHYGMSPWWGFVLPLAVNDGLPILRNLTDPLATAAVCGLLCGWLLGSRWWVVCLWGFAAVLSREQNVAAVGILLTLALFRRQGKVAGGLALVLVLWLAWVGVLFHFYGQSPILPAQEPYFGYPFAGMLFRWSHLDLSGSRLSAVLHGVRMSLLTLQILLALWLIFSRSDKAVRLVTLLGVGLAVTAGVAFYEDPWSYTRVFTWIPLGLWLASIQLRQRWPQGILLPAAIWPLVAVVQVW